MRHFVDGCSCPHHPWKCYGHPDSCPCTKDGTVTLPRAQHEALTAAVKALQAFYDYTQGVAPMTYPAAFRAAHEALAALRAAGIQP
jgi:hypothetical protein